MVRTKQKHAPFLIHVKVLLSFILLLCQPHTVHDIEESFILALELCFPTMNYPFNLLGNRPVTQMDHISIFIGQDMCKTVSIWITDLMEVHVFSRSCSRKVKNVKYFS